MLLKGDFLAARDLGQRFINVRFRPCQIVAFLKRSFGNSLVDKLARRRFDRCKIAARHAPSEPCFLFGIFR